MTRGNVDLGGRERTWFVAATGLLGKVVSQLAPEDRTAVAEGRVFVNGHRAQDSGHPVAEGDRISWHAKRPNLDDELVILGHRAGIVAIDKPTTWSSEPDATGQAQALSVKVAERFGRRVHVATRLDVGVSGIVLVALDARARQCLASQQASGSAHRQYLGIVAGSPEDRGVWNLPIFRPSRSGGKQPAETEFICLRRIITEFSSVEVSASPPAGVSLLSFQPRTGRRHQLRIHAARSGFPILGDRRYSGPSLLARSDGRVMAVGRIALHASFCRVRCGDGTDWRIVCPPSEDFARIWTRLGGTRQDWANAELGVASGDVHEHPQLDRHRA